MLTDAVMAELAQDQPTALHTQLLEHVRPLIDMSRQHMKTFYPKWDEAQNAYRAWQALDKEDRVQIEKGNPTKQRIPAVYAKIQTLKAFMISLYTQRPRFYELEPVGSEDHAYRELAEVLLDKDLKQNKWFNCLNQWTTHLGKYGMGVFKHSWEEQFAYIATEEERPVATFFGLKLGKAKTERVVKRVPKKLGNTVTVVSPYNFLPDVRMPLTDFENGEFCADECDMPMHKLRQLESEKACAGVEKINPLSQERAQWRMNNLATKFSKINYGDPTRTRRLVRVTEVQIKIIPSKFKLADGSALGPEDYPIKYLMWIANDSRIIRLESTNYLHDKFTWDVGVYDEDGDTFLSLSLTDLVSPLQDTADWFINSRVTNVSQNLEDKLIVDPVGVDMDSIKNRSRVILLKKGASRGGVDNYIKQMQVSDVTIHHMDDAANIGNIINSVSGLSENLSGSYHSGRRSATESRVVTQGAAARPKLTAQANWSMCLAPLGQKLLTNLRQGLTAEMIIRYAGQEYAEKPEVVQAFMSTPEELLCSCDLFAYEGTLESEKNYLAQQLMELLKEVIALGPSGLLSLELSPKLLIEKIYELLGVGSLSNFSLAKDPQTLQTIVMQLAQQMATQMVQQAQAQQPTTNESASPQQ